MAERMLRIAADFSIPIEAVTQTFAILAKRGRGKTYTACVIVEEMLEAGQHAVVVDPVGVWWGLRSSADGKGPGLPIVIMGGDHADVPLEASAGKLVADVIVDQRVSVVLDLGDFSRNDQARFMTDFAEELYRKNREPLHLVLDEADAFCPQNPLPESRRMLGAVEKIVRRGRARGLGVTLITQRAAVLNKNVLTQTEILVTLQITGPQDRKAIQEWISAYGDEADGRLLMSTLAQLPIGTAWFWSPSWLKEFRKVEIRKKHTFDSSATPKIGETQTRPIAYAKVDIDGLREQMAALIEHAAEDDPAVLRKRIKALEKQLESRQPAEVREVQVSIPVVDADLVEEMKSAAELWSNRVGDLEKILAEARKISQELFSTANRVLGSGWRPVEDAKAPTPTPVREKPDSTPRGDTTISTPQQNILMSLADFGLLGLQEVQRSILAVYAGQSPTSSGYGNNLGKLRTLGLIDYPRGGFVSITAAGRSMVPEPNCIPTLEYLHEAWFSKVTRPQAAILQAVIRNHPASWDREGLAEASGQSPTSSGYGNNLGHLRSLGLIEYPMSRAVAATELLFPPALMGQGVGK